MDDEKIQILLAPLAAMVVTIIAAAGAALFMSVRSAHAEIEGPCEATINGVTVRPLDSGSRGDDIHVSQHTAVPVSAESPAGFRSHKIQLEFASRRWTVSEQQDDGSTSWSDTVNVDDYATYGVGLYKVIGVSTLTDGTICEGAAMVDVAGNPLATVAGATAAGAAALGTVAAVGSGLRAATGDTYSRMPTIEEMAKRMQEVEVDRSLPPYERRQQFFTSPKTPNWAFVLWVFGCVCFAALALIMTPLMALVGGPGGSSGEPPQPTSAGGGQDAGQEGKPPQRLPRPLWFPKITLLGLVGGFLAGAGGVVLLQQYSIEYPTLAAIIRNVLVAMAIYGIALPTLGRTIAWLRLRRRVVGLERELGLS